MNLKADLLQDRNISSKINFEKLENTPEIIARIKKYKRWNLFWTSVKDRTQPPVLENFKKIGAQQFRLSKPLYDIIYNQNFKNKALLSLINNYSWYYIMPNDGTPLYAQSTFICTRQYNKTENTNKWGFWMIDSYPAKKIEFIAEVNYNGAYPSFRFVKSPFKYTQLIR